MQPCVKYKTLVFACTCNTTVPHLVTDDSTDHYSRKRITTSQQGSADVPLPQGCWSVCLIGNLLVWREYNSILGPPWRGHFGRQGIITKRDDKYAQNLRARGRRHGEDHFASDHFAFLPSFNAV
jgi:hypothetical protein